MDWRNNVKFFSSLDSYSRQFLAFFKEVGAYQRRKNTSYPMRIAGIEFVDKTGEALILVDVLGVVKHVLPRYKPSELIDDDVIENFPPKHIKMITFLACKNFFEQPAVFELVSSDMVDDQTIFTFKNLSNGNLSRQSAQNIMYNQNLFLKFSKQDIKQIDLFIIL